MGDSRTYTRLVCDTLIKQNIVCIFIHNIVKLYYTLFSHPLNLLKFNEKIPIKHLERYENISFDSEKDKKSILG